MQQKWVPEVGMLVVRQLLGVECNDVFLAYRDEASDEQQFQGIAVMKDFQAEPFPDKFEEPVATQLETVRDGRLIVRRYATNGDIVAFVKLWNADSSTLRQWVAKVVRMRGLAKQEKDRIQRLAQQA